MPAAVAGELTLPDNKTMKQASDPEAIVVAGVDLVLHSELLGLVAGSSHGADESSPSILIEVVVDIRAR